MTRSGLKKMLPKGNKNNGKKRVLSGDGKKRRKRREEREKWKEE